ncbi:UNVERIFIED_CONTAM: putative sugar phosphate/phosphate translocator [Sesamum calycinum]|uniref:Sugar phosphate/phosphate translocator n=1 Tax=Sesamum calycinum TaxID=2727403 RepID=A0AAW2NSR0_9LAMI
MGKGGALSEGVLKKIVLSYTYVAIWIFLSFTVIVYNKYILDRKLYNWPYPISLTMIHMAFCSSLAYILVRIFKALMPVAVYTIGVLFKKEDWLLIAFSWSVIMDTVTPINLVGYALAFLGVAYYNHSKLMALKAKDAQKKSQQPDDEEAGRLLEQREGENNGAKKSESQN